MRFPGHPDSPIKGRPLASITSSADARESVAQISGNCIVIGGSDEKHRLDIRYFRQNEKALSCDSGRGTNLPPLWAAILARTLSPGTAVDGDAVDVGSGGAAQGGDFGDQGIVKVARFGGDENDLAGIVRQRGFQARQRIGAAGGGHILKLFAGDIDVVFDREGEVSSDG